MTTFLVKVSYYAPYPKESEYRSEATNFGTAINRALKDWRKEQKGKRVKELTVKATKL
jgi:hypothetical protein